MSAIFLCLHVGNSKDLISFWGPHNCDPDYAALAHGASISTPCCGCSGRLVAQTGGRKSGRVCPLCPFTSDINLFRYCQGIIYLDTQISYRAFDLGMAKQKLDSPKIACAPVDQGSLRAIVANAFRKVLDLAQCFQSIQKRGARIDVSSCCFRDAADQ
jgi:hypothetical protein